MLVVTGSAMERSNIRDFDDLVKIAPSVTITKTSQPGNNSINIRGIGTYAYSIATEPSVAVVIDDVPQAFQAAAFAALVDVQQVEVLRGPQNTLFGKSASAGVISITTQPATDDIHGPRSTRWPPMMASIASPARSRARSTETLKFRLAANSSEYRGNVSNLTTGNWLNGTADTTLRGKLVWEPTSDWTVTLSPSTRETDASCCAGAEYFVSPGSTTGGAATGPGRIPMSTFSPASRPEPDNTLDAHGRRCARQCAGLRRGTQDRASDFGGYTLASITSYDRYELEDRQDTDSTDIDFSRVPADLAGRRLGERRLLRDRFEDPGIPAHVAGRERLRYVAGLFYSDTNSQRYFVRGSNTLDDYNDLADAVADARQLPTTNSTAYSRYLSTARATNYALFGQGNFGLTDQLDFLAGLRVNREEIEYTFYDLGNGVTFGSPRCSTDGAVRGRRSRPATTTRRSPGRAGLQYRFTPDVMASRRIRAATKDLPTT